MLDVKEQTNVGPIKSQMVLVEDFKKNINNSNKPTATTPTQLFKESKVKFSFPD